MSGDVHVRFCERPRVRSPRATHLVVLAADTPKGRQWADRALERIRQEAEAIGVSLNTEKTRLVTITDPRASFC
jgi:hypothetical protein